MTKRFTEPTVPPLADAPRPGSGRHDLSMMRRRDGSWETILNVISAEKIGTFTQDGFEGDVWLATEGYANSPAENPRILLTGPGASRVAAAGHRQCLAANQDRFRGAVVLTLEDADAIGIYTIPRSAFQFQPLSNE